MRILVTGGAGFIGRWVVKSLLQDRHQVWVVDDFSNGQVENLAEFQANSRLTILTGQVANADLMDGLFRQHEFDICFHLAANINVQASIDDPKGTFLQDITGTLTILEAGRSTRTKVVYISSCMVYDAAPLGGALDESSPVLPRSPYAAGKAAAEHLVRSYGHAYDIPVVILRPFNTYGPHQKTTAEGGVIAIFIKNVLNRQPIRVYGDGTQTRDFLYVEDCAGFIVAAGYSEQCRDELITAGTGRDININDLAKLMGNGQSEIVHVPHIHRQAEIHKLVCNPKKAEALLGWKPRVFLEEGIQKTKDWIRQDGH